MLESKWSQVSFNALLLLTDVFDGDVFCDLAKKNMNEYNFHTMIRMVRKKN